MASGAPAGTSVSPRRLVLLAPFVATAAAGGGFWAMLSRMSLGSFDPHDIHVPAQGRQIPAFDLPGLLPGGGFSSARLAAQDGPVLVNFFASWCVPCVLEAQSLVALSARLPLWGIAYKDAPDNARGFVARTATPYARLAADRSGLSAIDWGVSGVPESFLVAPGGRIAWHLAGPLTREAVKSGLDPALDGLRR